MQVYELASRNQPTDRNEVLSEWRKTGGVLVMGYQLFRILVNYTGKSKKTKQLYESSLIDPGKCVFLSCPFPSALLVFQQWTGHSTSWAEQELVTWRRGRGIDIDG